jgi:diacylglycerol kinase (ATP)
VAKPSRNGISRITHAAGYSWQGLRAAWTHETAFRQESALISMLFPLSFWVGADLLETTLLITVLFLVLLMELMNSAIEAVVDRIGPELHALSGRAKDIGSAAVLLSIILVVLVWGLIAIKNWPLGMQWLS